MKKIEFERVQVVGYAGDATCQVGVVGDCAVLVIECNNQITSCAVPRFAFEDEPFERRSAKEEEGDR